MTTQFVNEAHHPIGDGDYAASCRTQLEAAGALVLAKFFSAETIARIVDESSHHEADAFYANSTHNVYLNPPDPDADADHPRNRQIVSSKGLIADDQVPQDSPLRDVYEDATFRSFLCLVLGIDEIYPYADSLSSINVHFAAEGMELGWHFDNSSFAITLMIQPPKRGGVFEYVKDVRNADNGEMNYTHSGQILDGEIAVQNLTMEAVNGLMCVDADGMTIKNLNLKVSNYPALTFYNAKNVSIEKLQVNTSDKPTISVNGEINGKYYSIV